jgi:hypothetical protein
MKEELKCQLEDIMSNPSSGRAHDEKITLVQIQEIFAIDKLTEEVIILKRILSDYSKASVKENKSMRLLTVFMGVVAIFQLFIAYGQYKVGENQIEAARDQIRGQNYIQAIENLRNDRLEERDIRWRKEDLQFQGRLP